jgi:hypothetical protein
LRSGSTGRSSSSTQRRWGLAIARGRSATGCCAGGSSVRGACNVGIVLATSGPGATNLVTPIADAAMDSTPLVCITGQVRSPLIGSDAFQECDIVGITTPIVKHSWGRARPARGSRGAKGQIPRGENRSTRPSAHRHSTRCPGEPARVPLPGYGGAVWLGTSARCGARGDRTVRGRYRRGPPTDPVRRGRCSKPESAQRLCALADLAQIPVVTTLTG